MTSRRGVKHAQLSTKEASHEGKHKKLAHYYLITKTFTKMKDIKDLTKEAEKLARQRANGEVNGEGYLVQFHQIPTTPFSAAQKEDKWYIMWGMHVLLGELKSYEDCLEAFNTKFWEIVARYCIAANQVWLKDQEEK